MSTSSARAVITGAGVISPLGCSFREFGERLFEGRSGVRTVTRFDPSRFRCRRAAEVDDRAFQEVFKPPSHEVSRMGRFVWLSLAAAREALADSQLQTAEELPGSGALFVGVSMGGLPEVEAGVLQQESRGPGKTLPYLIPSLIPNMAASQIALQHRFHGPQYTLSGACASGSQALGLALAAVRRGEVRWALAGGAEAVVTPITFSGFEAMRALSTTPGPRPTPRPFDGTADGLIVGEGAAFFVIEDADRAAARGRASYGELRGCFTTSQGDRLILQSIPAAADCMRGALNQAGIPAAEIDAVFAQATGLLAGDQQELHALHAVFAESPRPPAIVSIKGHIGHTFGASGPLSMAAALHAFRRQRVPATLSFQSAPAEAPRVELSGEARDRAVRHCIVNSYGFGCINTCLVLTAPPDR